MIWRTVFTAIAAVLLMLALPACAVEKVRDLGPIPTNGEDAAATVPSRSETVIRELACGSEWLFLDKIRADPDKRPLEMLLAKAAVLAGKLNQRSIECVSPQLFESEDWDASMSILHILTNVGDVSMPMPDVSWPVLKDAIKGLNEDLNKRDFPAPGTRPADNAAEILRLLNKLELDTFGQECSTAVSDVLPVWHIWTPNSRGYVEYRVMFSLSAACLERQINHVIRAHDLGRNGNNPGTSGLPCHLALSKAPHGDWDMAVANFTRLAFLLREAGALRTMSAESAKTTHKLRYSLLTLSGEPAAEVHPIWKCGNPDNQYGSARDRLDDKDFYDPDLSETVEGEGKVSRGWDDLLGGLLLLLALLLLAMALAAIGPLLVAMFGPVIATAMLTTLAGIAIAEDVPELIAGMIAGGVEETENHLLMQNSAKYLMNKMLMEEAGALGDADAVRVYQEYNNAIHEWFMERLHRIVVHDFSEYNAKPYGAYSHIALLNIHDFICSAGAPSNDPICRSDDPHPLRTAIAGVFDLTATKMALSSNQGRRIIPFRRLAHTNTSYTIGYLNKDLVTRSPVFRLFDLARTADHWIAAMQLWTGQTFHGPEGHASQASLAEMIWEATGLYRPHALILDIAVDKSTPYRQTYHHAGWERYSSGPGWLLTAGGTETGYAQGFRTPFGVMYPEKFIKPTDRGAGVPTTLIVTAGERVAQPEGVMQVQRVKQLMRQDTFNDFIRFEGKPVHWEPDDRDEPMSFNGNFCVFGTFACGINMQIPDWLKTCRDTYGSTSIPSTRTFSVIDSSTCEVWNDGNTSNDFYAVIYQQPCNGTNECHSPSSWGFIEIIEKSAFADIKTLKAAVIAKNASSFDVMGKSGGTGEWTYDSISNGIIKFQPGGSYVTAVNGVAQFEWPRASGDIVNKVGEGHYTITNPRTKQVIDIDFSNQENPKRVLPP